MPSIILAANFSTTYTRYIRTNEMLKKHKTVQFYLYTLAKKRQLINDLTSYTEGPANYNFTETMVAYRIQFSAALSKKNKRHTQIYVYFHYHHVNEAFDKSQAEVLGWDQAKL